MKGEASCEIHHCDISTTSSFCVFLPGLAAFSVVMTAESFYWVDGRKSGVITRAGGFLLSAEWDKKKPKTEFALLFFNKLCIFF